MNPPRRPPFRGPQAPGPQRPGVRLPQSSEEQVEVSKIDPQALLEQGLRQQGKLPPTKPRLSSAEEDLMANAVPISMTDRPATPPKKPPEAEAKETFLPPLEADTGQPTDTISKTLIDRLSARFGLTLPAVQDMFLEAGDKMVKVSIRKPFYDDYIWTVGVIEQMLETGEDTTLIRGEAQRSQFLEHLSACRCVVKIEDEYVWDVFGYRSVIKATRPEWNGENYAQVPDKFIGALAQAVHALLRRLHPDLLFDLSKAVKLGWPSLEDETEKDAEAQDEGNPTGAA